MHWATDNPHWALHFAAFSTTAAAAVHRRRKMDRGTEYSHPGRSPRLISRSGTAPRRTLRTGSSRLGTPRACARAGAPRPRCGRSAGAARPTGCCSGPRARRGLQGLRPGSVRVRYRAHPPAPWPSESPPKLEGPSRNQKEMCSQLHADMQPRRAALTAGETGDKRSTARATMQTDSLWQPKPVPSPEREILPGAFPPAPRIPSPRLRQTSSARSLRARSCARRPRGRTGSAKSARGACSCAPRSPGTGRSRAACGGQRGSPPC